MRTKATFASRVDLQDGGYHGKPSFMNDSIYAIIEECFRFNSLERPTFLMLVDEFIRLKNNIKEEDKLMVDRSREAMFSSRHSMARSSCRFSSASDGTMSSPRATSTISFPVPGWCARSAPSLAPPGQGSASSTGLRNSLRAHTGRHSTFTRESTKLSEAIIHPLGGPSHSNQTQLPPLPDGQQESTRGMPSIVINHHVGARSASATLGTMAQSMVPGFLEEATQTRSRQLLRTARQSQILP